MADANYADVSLLLPFDGDNNSTAFYDYSTNNFAVTTVGGAKQDTSTAKYGQSSGNFLTTGSELTLPDNSKFTFGTGAFTVEGWFKPTAELGGGLGLFYLHGTVNGANAIQLGVTDGKAVFGAPASSALTYTGTISTSAFTHIAFVYDGTDRFIFIDGVQVATSTTAITLSQNDITHVGSIVPSNSTYRFNGYIDDLRVTKGVARYSTTFTPAVNYTPSFSGNITESLDITDWRVTATRCSDATLMDTAITTVSSYALSATYNTPCVLTISANFDYHWSKSKVAVLDDLVIPSNPQTTPHLFKVTTAGDFDATTEATWNLSGTTTQGTAVLTYVGPLPDRPLSLGPVIPS